MRKGFLLFELRKDNGTKPIIDAKIKITNIDGREVSKVLSVDKNGRSELFEVYTKDSSLTFDESNKIVPYTYVDAEIKCENDKIISVDGIQIYSDVTSIQEIKLDNRLSENKISKDKRSKTKKEHIHFRNENPSVFEEDIREKEGISLEETVLKPIATSKKISIPEFITVHLGEPNDRGENITVPFIDYVKNVCCSEIYPTWRDEAIKANIHSIVSFALNRVYTDWYRSRGYGFEITSSKNYDQKYVRGRNLFENVCSLVDGHFDECIMIKGFNQPIVSKCVNSKDRIDGLCRWGSLELSEKGIRAEEIVKKYYGDNIIISVIDDIEGIMKKYPKTFIKKGDKGENVRIIQKMLNRIGKNYLTITKILDEDGIFGDDTYKAVKDFQKIFNLEQDGIIGKKTWNKLFLIYSLTKRLSPVDDDYDKLEDDFREFKYLPLEFGKNGEEVKTLQKYLNLIFKTYNFFTEIAEDGYFGEKTKEAVEAFQKKFDLLVDGIFGEKTLSKLEDIKDGSNKNSSRQESKLVKENQVDEKFYIPLKQGDKGEEITKLQKYLNYVANYYGFSKLLQENGEFDQDTLEAIRSFQKMFKIEQNGIMDRRTWNKLILVYNLTKDLLKNEENNQEMKEGMVKEFQVPLYLGKKGDDIKKLQEYLNLIFKTYSFYKEIKVDGYYGDETKKAVEAFQKKFDLLADGIFGQKSFDKLEDIMKYMVLRDRKDENNKLSLVIPIKKGDSGENVKKLQRYLNYLSRYYGFLKVLAEDGFYGDRTYEIVKKFQEKFGLRVDGIFGEESLNKMNSLYNAINELNIDESICMDLTKDNKDILIEVKEENSNQVKQDQDKVIRFTNEYSMKYPNFELNEGVISGYVTLVQKYLNRIKESNFRYFSNAKYLEEDGKFLQETKRNVLEFQKIMNLNQTGVIDENTWNFLVFEYENSYNNLG